MTLRHATYRNMSGNMLFVHTPAPPHEKFYFFAPGFETLSLPMGRRLRKLDGMVMLVMETPGHPEAPYFYWRLAEHVAADEVLASARIFCELDRFNDARTLRESFPEHFCQQA